METINDLLYFDNKGQTFDRYTVLWPGDQGEYLGMSHNPYWPQGFCQHGEGAIPGPHLGKQITFEDLPPDCQRAVLEDLKDPEDEEF